MKKSTLNKFAKTDLILSGGGSRGIFQLGFLQELASNGVIFNRIFGNSIGTINAIGYSSNFESLENVWLEIINGKEFYTKGLFGMGWIAKGLFGGDSLYNNEPLYKKILTHYDIGHPFKRGQVFFDVVCQEKGRLYHVTKNNINGPEIVIYNHDGTLHWVINEVMCTNYISKTKYEHKNNIQEIWAKLILASTAIPVFFKPVEIECLGLHLVDGGVRNIAPTSFPINIGSKRMLIVLNNTLDVDKKESGTNILEIGARNIEITTNEIYRRDIYILEYINQHLSVADKRDGRRFIEYEVIKPDFSLKSSLDTNHDDMVALLKHGRELCSEYLSFKEK